METPQHGNVSTRKCLKNRFWGISVFLGKEETTQQNKVLKVFSKNENAWKKTETPQIKEETPQQN